MGALIMFGFVSLIAIVGGIYFYLEDKKEIRTRQNANLQSLFPVTFYQLPGLFLLPDTYFT